MRPRQFKLFAILLAITALPAAAQSRSAQHGERDGVEVKATPLTRPAVLAFYQARGFSAQAISPYADACVFSFELRNTTRKTLRLRLADEGLVQAGSNKPLVIDFAELHRSHPLVSVLAEYLIETSLQDESAIAARCAATVTVGVDRVTTVVLLRLRHQLAYQHREHSHQMLAEECVALAIRGRQNPEWLTGPEAARLLESTPAGNLPREAVQREVAKALAALQAEGPRLDALARQRATELLQDHERVRQATDRRSGGGQHQVQACLPVDVVGVYVLLPDAA